MLRQLPCSECQGPLSRPLYFIFFCCLSVFVFIACTYNFNSLWSGCKLSVPFNLFAIHPAHSGIIFISNFLALLRILCSPRGVLFIPLTGQLMHSKRPYSALEMKLRESHTLNGVNVVPILQFTVQCFCKYCKSRTHVPRKTDRQTSVKLLQLLLDRRILFNATKCRLLYPITL